LNVFNARFIINNCIPVASNEWSLEATVQDALGFFLAGDAQPNDVIYAFGASQATGAILICKYKMKTINSIDGASINCNVEWDEVSLDDVCDPQTGDDAFICRRLSSGLAFLPSQAMGISEFLLSYARSIENASYSATSTPKNTKKESFIVNGINYTLSFPPLTESLVVTYNGMVLTINDDFTLTGKLLTLIDDGDVKNGDMLQLFYEYI